MRAAAPIGVAALAFGVSYGVLARSAGWGRVAPVVMSLTTFAGSAQFAAVSILGAGGGLVTAVVAAVLLNLRYGPIGLSAASAITGPWWKRLLTAQLIVDESWAIAQRDDGRLDRHLLVGAGLLLLVGWTAGTVVGAFAGDLVADPESLGLDAAFPALFLALLWPQVRDRTRLLAALGGGHRPRPHARHRGRGADRGRQPGLPDRGAAVMNAVWVTVVVVGLATIAIKAAGPLLVAARTIPPRAQSALEHLAPAVLAALVGGRHHELGHGVHQLGDDRVVLAGALGGPVAGHPLVGRAAEDEHVAVVELAGRESIELLVDGPEVELLVEAFVEAVEGHHQKRVEPPHHVLLMIASSRHRLPAGSRPQFGAERVQQLERAVLALAGLS